MAYPSIICILQNYSYIFKQTFLKINDNFFLGSRMTPHWWRMISVINAVHSLLVVLCLLTRCRQLVGHRYKVGFTLLFSNSFQTMFVGSVNTFASRETCSELVSECYLRTMFANSLHTYLCCRLNMYKNYSMVNYKKIHIFT